MELKRVLQTEYIERLEFPLMRDYQSCARTRQQDFEMLRIGDRVCVMRITKLSHLVGQYYRTVVAVGYVREQIQGMFGTVESVHDHTPWLYTVKLDDGTSVALYSTQLRLIERWYPPHFSKEG